MASDMLISLAKLYTAFKLSPTDLADLLRLLPTPPIIPLNRLIIDPSDQRAHENDHHQEFTVEMASEYAKRYTRGIFNIPRIRWRLVDLVLKHLLDLYHELEVDHEVMKEWEAIAARWTNEYFYAIIICYLDGRLHVLRREICERLKDSYLLFSMVHLEEVVPILYASFYPLKMEVKGLTQERYHEIIKGLQIPPPEEKHAPAVPDEPPPDNQPTISTVIDPTPKSGQRRLPVSTLLKAIRAEANAHGLGEQYYVTSDRAIRNWLSGASTPPSGFSVEVLYSLESILEFARKYIEASIANGSSELAANAKKEVAFNPQLHGMKLETAEDAAIMMEALKDVAERLPSGSKPEVKRKPKRN